MRVDSARWFKHHISAILARCARRDRLTVAELAKLRPVRILVVRQHNQMGDMVCATPTLRAIRETWPEAEIALVTAPVNREVVAHNPDLDRVFTFDRRVWQRPGRLLGFLGEIRGFRPELALVLSSVSFSVTSAWIAAASGAPFLVGADSRPFGWDISRHLFSLEMPASPRLDCHAVAHSLAPLQAVGITTKNVLPVMVPAPTEQAGARRILSEWGWDDGYWVVHPGAGKRQNIWPASRFAEVIRRARIAGNRVLILHGPADAEPLLQLEKELAGLMGADLRVAPLCSVGVAAALLQRADRLLCNDTGVMHVAGAIRVPTIALFGVTDPRLWKPPAPEVQVIKSPRQSDVTTVPGLGGDEFGWMENIEVDTVWSAWSRLPARTDGNQGV